MRMVWPLVACALLVQAAQQGAWQRNPQRGVHYETRLEHDNGLLLAVPEGFVEAEVDRGYVFTEMVAGPEASEIRLEVFEEEPRSYRAMSMPLSWIAGDATYVVTRQRSRFGTDEHILKAYRPQEDAWLMLTATVADQGARPDFSVAWALLDQARLRLLPAEPHIRRTY